MRSWANHRFCRLFLWQRNLPRMFWSQFSVETGEHHCQRNPCQVVRPQGYEGWTVGGICTEFWVESSKMFCSKQDKKLLEALASFIFIHCLFIVHQLSPKNSWFFTGTMRAAGAWTCWGEDQRWLDQGRLEEEQAGQNCVLDRYARIL